MNKVDEYLWLFDQRMRVRDSRVREVLIAALDIRFRQLSPTERLFADVRRQRLVMDYGREIGVFQGTLRRTG